MKSALFVLKAFLAAVFYPLFVGLTQYMSRQGLILHAYYFPEGSKFYFSSTFAAALEVTAVSNADPAIATSAGHGLVDLDEVLFTSGWEDATDSVFRVDQQNADTFKLLGLDSTDTNWFAALGGVGSVKKISNWVEIPQALNIQTSGGGPRFSNVEPLAKRNAIAVPTGFDPMNITFTVGHDAALDGFKKAIALTRTLTKVAFKAVISGGAVGYGYGHIAASEMPSMNRGRPNETQVAISLLGRFISY